MERSIVVVVAQQSQRCQLMSIALSTGQAGTYCVKQKVPTVLMSFEGCNSHIGVLSKFYRLPSTSPKRLLSISDKTSARSPMGGAEMLVQWKRRRPPLVLCRDILYS